ncbi:hypothetical protein SLE2022_372100 [Rubroshorea leprosula]
MGILVSMMDGSKRKGDVMRNNEARWCQGVEWRVIVWLKVGIKAGKAIPRREEAMERVHLETRLVVENASYGAVVTFMEA